MDGDLGVSIGLMDLNSEVTFSSLDLFVVCETGSPIAQASLQFTVAEADLKLLTLLPRPNQCRAYESLCAGPGYF